MADAPPAAGLGHEVGLEAVRARRVALDLLVLHEHRLRGEGERSPPLTTASHFYMGFAKKEIKNERPLFKVASVIALAWSTACTKSLCCPTRYCARRKGHTLSSFLPGHTRGRAVIRHWHLRYLWGFSL